MRNRIVEELVHDKKFSSFGFKRSLQRCVSLFLCAALILSLSACWSRRELNTLAIVLGTAFDSGKEPNTIQITTQIVKPGGLKATSSSSEDTQIKAFANIKSSGDTVLSALSGFTHITNRRMYFSHNRVLIFSSELAEKSVMDSLDAFTRNYETRMNVYILISKGRASEILEEELELEQIPANHLAELLENQRSNSESAIVTLRDFSIATLSSSTSPVAPLIEMYEANGKKKARIEGTAVFKQGKMIGEFDVAQTRGLMWVTGKAQKNTITIDARGGKVDLIIVHANGSMKPVKTEDGAIRMKININADGSIESNETGEDMSNVDSIEMLTNKAQEYVRDDIDSALKQAEYLSADVFGFGEAIRRDYPKDWENLKGNWDNEFRKLECDIEVNIKIERTGGMGKPIVPGGAQ